MKTSAGRFLYYGPYIMPSTPITQAHFSVFGNEDTHTVKGFFTDPLSVHHGVNKVTGVVLEPRTQMADVDEKDDKTSTEEPRQVTTVSIPERDDGTMFLTSNPWTAFISYSVFIGARRVLMQRDGSRCTGLLAEFGIEGGVPVTAGQWRPSETGSIELLYDAETNGPLKSLTFIYSGPTTVSNDSGNPAPPAVFVEDILPNKKRRPTSKPYCFWHNLNQVRTHGIVLIDSANVSFFSAAGMVIHKRTRFLGAQRHEHIARSRRGRECRPLCDCHLNFCVNKPHAFSTWMHFFCLCTVCDSWSSFMFSILVYQQETLDWNMPDMFSFLFNNTLFERTAVSASTRLTSIETASSGNQRSLSPRKASYQADKGFRLSSLQRLAALLSVKDTAGKYYKELYSAST